MMRRRKTYFPLFFLLAIAAGGCGYHVPGRSSLLPESVRTVRLEFFANRTLEPLVETVLSEELLERFSRGRALQVVNRLEEADAVLTGTVDSYAADPAAYGTDDRIAQWRSAMTATAVLRRAADAQVLWRGTVTWTETYAADPDKAAQEENEALAIRTMSRRMAEEFYFRLTDNF